MLVYSIKIGDFETDQECEVKGAQLPQFTHKKDFDISLLLFDNDKYNNKYNAVLGRDFLQDIGLDVLNSAKMFKWGNIEVPMVSRGHWQKDTIGKF